MVASGACESCTVGLRVSLPEGSDPWCLDLETEGIVAGSEDVVAAGSEDAVAAEFLGCDPELCVPCVDGVRGGNDCAARL